MEKKVFICCFPVDAFSYLATHFMRSIPMKGSLELIATSIVKLAEGVLCSAFQEKYCVSIEL